MADTLVWSPPTGMITTVASVTLTGYDWLSLDAGVTSQSLDYAQFGHILQSIRGAYEPRSLNMTFDIVKTTTSDLMAEVRKLQKLSGLESSTLVWTPSSSSAITFDVLNATVTAPIGSDYNLNVLHVTIAMIVQPYASLPERTTFYKNLVMQGCFDRPNICYENLATCVDYQPCWNVTDKWNLIETLTSGATETILDHTSNTGEVTIAATTTYLRSTFRITLSSATTGNIRLYGRKSAGATGTLSISVSGWDGSSLGALTGTIDISTLGTSDGYFSVTITGWRPVVNYIYAAEIRATSISGTVYLRNGTSDTATAIGTATSTDSGATWTWSDSDLMKQITGLTYARPGARLIDTVGPPSTYNTPQSSTRWVARLYKTSLAASATIGYYQVLDENYGYGSPGPIKGDTSYWMGYSIFVSNATSTEAYMRMRVVWQDSGGSTISTSTYTNPSGKGAWYRFRGQAVTSPTNARQCEVYIEFYNSTGGAISVDAYITEVMLIENMTSAPSYFIESFTQMPARLTIPAEPLAGDDFTGASFKFLRARPSGVTNSIAGLHIATGVITEHNKFMMPVIPTTAARYYMPATYGTVNPPDITTRSMQWNVGAAHDYTVVYSTYAPSANTAAVALAWQTAWQRTADPGWTLHIPPVFGTFRVLVRTACVRYATTEYTQLRFRVGMALSSSVTGGATVSETAWVPVNYKNGATEANTWGLTDLGTIYIPPPQAQFETPSTSFYHYLYLDMKNSFTMSLQKHCLRIDSFILLPTDTYLVVKDNAGGDIIPSQNATGVYLDTRNDLRGYAETSVGYLNWKAYMRGTAPKIGNRPQWLFITQDWDVSDNTNETIDLWTITYNPTLRGIGNSS